MKTNNKIMDEPHFKTPEDEIEDSLQLSGEIKEVKALGERIGYGHLMALASALWRKKLKEAGMPTTGAFYGTILPLIKKTGRTIAEKEIKLYDELIK